MPDRVDAEVDSMEAPAADAPLDRRRSKPDLDELPVADHAVLLRCERCDFGFDSAPPVIHPTPRTQAGRFRSRIAITRSTSPWGSSVWAEDAAWIATEGGPKVRNATRPQGETQAGYFRPVSKDSYGLQTYAEARSVTATVGREGRRVRRNHADA